jgi:NADPH:quinone reductase-like Zn-dependent oxidoreductase
VKAAIIREYGSSEELEVADVPEPRLEAPDEMIVDVRAASVNPVDFKIRDGELRRLIRYRFPLVLGNDLAGVVREAGPAVARFRPGDRVFARLAKDRIGAFAERAPVREAHAAAIPGGLGFEDAASLPLVALTAWQAFVDCAALAPGQRVLVHAGAGGLGTAAIQIAKHLGAWVATTASARRAPLLRSLGADQVVDYKTERFDEVVRDVDVVLDTIGGETQTRSLHVLRPGGVLVAVTGLPDAAFAREWGMAWFARAALALLGRRRAALVRRLGVRYRFLFMRPSGEQLARVGELVAAGKVRPVIDRVFPLEEARAALEYVEAGHACGKVVIRVGGAAA